MPNYCRVYIPGGTYFLTLVTYRRRPLFKNSSNINLLRSSIAKVKAKKPFKIIAAVVLPEHIHFVWQLPPNDSDYSQRISRLKVLFTRAFKLNQISNIQISESRRKHRESDVWQRRFWEHLIRDETDLQQHLDYVHYNPVKHGLVSCPHLWEYSSFSTWIKKGRYSQDWGCICGGKALKPFDFKRISQKVRE
ncbi:transposase [Hyella patelloides LEGE 07179]|uniref:Transposase n=1 Tax=Hyella patelloides LEGE 07179 TaxID=945734 RepID=A0A563VQ95_9CYAN|nr:transposase [Hyella patelloides]VEP13581.1 transposase [Hyella patelloides LEGE 07179]